MTTRSGGLLHHPAALNLGVRSGTSEVMSFIYYKNVDGPRPGLKVLVRTNSNRRFGKATDMKLPEEFLRPLLPKVSRRKNQHIAGGTGAQRLPDYCTSLNRLTKTHLVS